MMFLLDREVLVRLSVGKYQDTLQLKGTNLA